VRQFQWPLQRLQDVTAQRELALRSELLTLLQQVTWLRQEIVRRRAALRSMLSELAEMDLAERMRTQEVFMRTAAWAERRIDELRGRVKEMTARRTEMTAQLLKIRKSKETLERLRQEARREYMRHQRKLEQKQFDQTAQVAFARGVQHRRGRSGRTGAPER